MIELAAADADDAAEPEADGVADADPLGIADAAALASGAAEADAAPGTRSKLSKNAVFMMFSDALNVGAAAGEAWFVDGPASDGVLLPGGTHATPAAAAAPPMSTAIDV